MKNLIAIVLGVLLLGVGIWRLSLGELGGGGVCSLAGLVLAIRGLTGTVRPGL